MAFTPYFTGYEYFVVPFLFIFAIVFGSLRVANIFKNKKVDAVIAVALAIFAVYNSALVNFLWDQLGFVTLFFVFMFMIIFVLKVFGVGSRNAEDAFTINIAILFILLSIGYLYSDMITGIPILGGGDNFLFAVMLVRRALVSQP